MDVCFLGSNKNIEKIKVDKKRTKFICFDWWTYAEVKKYGLEAIEYDALINQEDGEHANRFVEEVLKNWYKTQGVDITEFEGISVGNLLGWYMRREVVAAYKFLICVSKIMKKEKPVEIYFDAELGESKKRIVEIVIKNKVVLLNLEKTPGEINEKAQNPDPFVESLVSFRMKKKQLPSQNIKTSLLNAFDAINNLFPRKKSEENVLFTYYQSLEPVIDEIVKNRKNIQLYFGSRCLRYATYPTISLNRKNISGKVGDRIREIKSKWNLAKGNKKELNRKFCYFNENISDLIVEIIDRTLENEIEEIVDGIIEYRNYFRKKNIQLVVVPYDITSTEQCLIQTARILGIPSMLLLHGYPHPIIPPERGDNLSTDHVLVWGDKLRQMYQKLDSRKKVYAVGNPKFDIYGREMVKITQEGETISSDKKKILLLSSPKIYSTIFSPIFSSETYLLGIVKILKEHKNVEITLKIHPSENIEYFERILEMNKDIKIVKTTPIEHMIAEADIVICPFVTTAIFESIAMGKETLIVNVPKIKYEKQQSFMKTLGIIDNLKVLEKKLDVLMTMNRKTKKNSKIKNIKQMETITGPIDGQSSKRVAELIERIIKK